MSPSDLTLAQRWMDRRDGEAFQEIVRRHSAMVYATCRRILRNTDDAEEVAQVCFLTLALAKSPASRRYRYARRGHHQQTRPV